MFQSEHEDFVDRIRRFSLEEAAPHGVRQLESAPLGMRSEFVAALYTLSDEAKTPFTQGPRFDVDRDLYVLIEQTLGMEEIANEPSGGRRLRLGRDLASVNWTRFYDLILALWPYFVTRGIHDAYRTAVNKLLAAYSVAWDLDTGGALHRVLPKLVEPKVAAAFAKLQDERFAAACSLATDAQDAYDARPRRKRDSCANVFDAMESIAKVTSNMPGAKFNTIINELRTKQVLNEQIVGVLSALNILRHRTFGHGMAEDFGLKDVETDFVYLTCVAGILLFMDVCPRDS